MADAYERVEVGSRAEWRAWLAEHHLSTPGIWLVTWKKASGGPYLPYDDIVEEALCFGWIDGRVRRVDEGRSALLMTPRRPTGGWSRPNKERVERLTAAGLMAPPGLEVVAVAKANGTWSALDAVEALEEPDDLRAALDAVAEARAAWDAFPQSARKALLYWVTSARRPATRARRVAETVARAAAGERADERRPAG